MRVFLSWSGEKSRAVAEALRDWLPSVVNEIEPFISAKDVAAGARWQSEIASQLESTQFGIVCVTGQNQGEAWLNFEAGAIAKTLGSARVVPLLIDLTPTDLTLPLAQFQAQPRSRDGIAAILQSINRQCEKPLDDERLLVACDVWWPRLAEQFDDIDTRSPGVSSSRTDRDLLEEVLASVRPLAEQLARHDDLSRRAAEMDARSAHLQVRTEAALSELADTRRELDARRVRDGRVADLVLHSLQRLLPSKSRVVVLDDYLQPRVLIETDADISDTDVDDIRREAGRLGFLVEFADSDLATSPE